MRALNAEPTWQDIVYGQKRREPVGSRALRHTGMISAGVYLGSLITHDVYLALASLAVALGCSGVRHLVYERRR